MNGRSAVWGAALLLLACGDSAEPEPAVCATGCDGADGAALAPSGDASVSDGAVDASESSSLPCTVQKIVADKCGLCHGAPPSYGAQMSLTSLAQFHAPGGSDKTKPYWQLAKTRINAPGAAQMPPPNAKQQLDAQELSTLNAWLDQGAPAGQGACNGASDAGTSDGAVQPDAGADTSDLTCYRFLARGSDLKSPYKVGTANDAYFDVRFDAPWQGTAYGVVIRPIINNKAVLHHWLLYQDSAKGAPTGAVKSNGSHPGSQLLAGWAPGEEGTDLRETGVDVGLELPQTSYTVEFHYNSSDANATDASGVEVCVAKTKPANIAALSWVGHENWPTAFDFLGPRSAWTGTCRHTSQQPIHILSVWPHMHLQGIHMKGTITRKDGTKETLHDGPFQFEFQRRYAKKTTLNPGDVITTECTYKQPMSFGEGTNEEMCYLFTLAYPKGALSDGKPYGRRAHGSSACLNQ